MTKEKSKTNVLKMYRFTVIIFIAFLILSIDSFAQSVILIYPAGRFQEENPPTTFRWQFQNKVNTLTLKVFYLKENGIDDPKAELVGRFDLLGDRQFFNWPLEPFNDGRYQWSLEGYDNNPDPVFSQDQFFLIEKYAPTDLKKKRISFFGGISRGSYSSSDPTYSIDFQTAPVIYGLSYRGGKNNFWEFIGEMSDFTLKGKLHRKSLVSASYSFQISSESQSKLECFIGPSLSLISFPRVTTLDGQNIQSKSIWQLNPGGLFSSHMHINLKTTIYTQFSFNLPVATSPTEAQASNVMIDDVNYAASLGVLFGQFWPLALGGEIQYKIENSRTMNSDQEVFIKQDSLLLVPQLIYTF